MTTPRDTTAAIPPSRSRGPWADSLGVAGARAGQLLLIGAVVGVVVWLLLRVTLVVIAVLVALILASALSPLVRWLVGKGWAPVAATLAAFLALTVLLVGVVGGVVMAIRNEWGTLISSAEEGWEQLQSWIVSGPVPVDPGLIDEATQRISDLVASGDFAGNLASSTLVGLSAATEVLTGMVLVIVLLFFFLKDGTKIWNFFLRWFHGETRAKLAETADRSSAVLGGYVRGTATVALVDASLIGIGLAVIGVPLTVPLAVIVFIGAFIPVVGATLAGILAAAVTLVTIGPLEALIVVIIVVGVNQLEGNLLQPVVMGRTLSLHPLIVLLALTIGTILGGIFGAVLAVPYTAMAWTVVQIWTDRYQAGPDPVLGDDPLDPKDRVANKATVAQRWKYRRMRRQRNGGSLGAAGSETTDPTPTDRTTMDAPRRFDTISVIFNPNSTGDAPRLAHLLRDQLLEGLPDSPDVRLLPTQHAGHAVDLAREAAAAPNALVVSVSGDGGYNEVVNGVMAAGSRDAVCAVMAAGNANDHQRTSSTTRLDRAIIEGQVRTMDLLRITVGDDPETQAIYAHSYIGFGLTPVVAIDMEKGNKGALKEMVSVVRTFSRFEPFRIEDSNGVRREIDSLVFANIPQMAKYATLSEAQEQPHDGKFEVILFPHTAKWRVLLKALRAATTGLGDQPSVRSYEFTTLDPLPYQLDGEVRSAPARTTVRVESVPSALSVIG